PRNAALASASWASSVTAASCSRARPTRLSRSSSMSGSPARRWPPRRDASGRLGGRTETGLDLLDDGAEGRLVVDRQLGKHLAVDADLGLVQPVHEHAVGQPVLPRGGVDPGDPERAEHALAVAAIAVGILPRLHHRFLGDAVDVAAAAAVALRLVQHLLVAGPGGHTSLD